jgi:hypothetical protein
MAISIFFLLMVILHLSPEALEVLGNPRYCNAPFFDLEFPRSPRRKVRAWRKMLVYQFVKFRSEPA